jgi:hypothetical protein
MACLSLLGARREVPQVRLLASLCVVSRPLVAVTELHLGVTRGIHMSCATQAAHAARTIHNMVKA